MEQPSCDLCGETAFTSLYAESEWFKVAPRPYRLVKCARCGLIYQNPRPSKDEIGRYYQDSYACYKEEPNPNAFFLLKWMSQAKLRKRRKMIEKYSGKMGGSILDVGSATGLFLSEMKAAGWSVTGVEPSASAAAYAREKLGLTVLQGYLDQVDLAAESFDAITYWDVLEHTFSPKQELARAVSLLKKGGLLAINVPNYDSYERKWLDVYWLGLDPPRHFYVFNQRTLAEYLEGAGLEILDWVCFIPAYFSSAISVLKWMEIKHPTYHRAASRVLNFPGMRFVFEPWYWISNRQKKSGIISVFAVKRVDVLMRKFIRDFAGMCAKNLPVQDPVYEFGSFQVEGQEAIADLRVFFPGLKYVGSDMRPGPGVDTLLNLHQLELQDESVGTALLMDTLEHVEYPHLAMQEVFRVLKPGGVAILSSVMNFPIHDYPYDYWRFTPAAFESLLKPFGACWVDCVGEKDFPHTVVGVGIKGNAGLPVAYARQAEEWKRRAGQQSLKQKIRMFIPPVAIKLYDAIRQR